MDLTQNATMSSMEIAKISGQEHYNLMKAIRKMETSWEKVTSKKFLLTHYEHSTNGIGKKKSPMYQLTKEESLYIATKFNDEARARLILRWMELEQGKAEKPVAVKSTAVNMGGNLPIRISHSDFKKVVVNNMQFSILPNKEYGFFVTSSELAFILNYKNTGSLDQFLKKHIDLLNPGYHYFKGVYLIHKNGRGAAPHRLFSRDGVIFLCEQRKNYRSNSFQKFAWDYEPGETRLLLSTSNKSNSTRPWAAMELLRNDPEAISRHYHNRLTADRLVDLLTDVARIENNDLRQSLVNKLTGRV